MARTVGAGGFVAAVIVLGMVSCGDDSDETAASPPASSTHMATTTVPAGGIALRDDGLGSFEFGAAFDAVAAELTVDLGEPDLQTSAAQPWPADLDAWYRPGWTYQRAYRELRWSDVGGGTLSVVFTDSSGHEPPAPRLVAWQYSDGYGPHAPDALTTPDGLTLGLSVNEVRAIEPDAEFRVDATCFDEGIPAFSIPGSDLRGQLWSLEAPEDTIRQLTAGDPAVCQPAASPPSRPPTSPIDSSIELRGDGLGAVSLDDPADEALATLTTLLGDPAYAEIYGDLDIMPIGNAFWRETANELRRYEWFQPRLTVEMTDAVRRSPGDMTPASPAAPMRFVSWTYGGAGHGPRAFATTDGVTVGTALDELQATYPNVEFPGGPCGEDAPRSFAIPDEGLSGSLDPTGTWVAALSAGSDDSC